MVDRSSEPIGVVEDDPRPKPPVRPPPEACCGSGCVRCIFEVYEEALERYREALEDWQRRHPPADAG